MTHRSRGTRRLADEAGIALPLALLGLVAVSLLVTAALVSSSTEVAISSAQQDATRDFYRAEGAVERYVATNANSFGPTAAAGVSYQPDTGTDPVRMTVTELSRVTVSTNPTIYKRTYAIQAQPLTSVGSPRGRRVVAMVQDSFKVDSLKANIEGAATSTSANVRIGGSSFVSGKTDARLCASGADTVKAVVLARDSQNVDIKAQNIDGGLDEVEKKDLSRAELAKHVLGGLTPYEMASYASIKFGFGGQPAWSGGKPNSSNPRPDKLNWGCPLKLYQVFDPGRACAADGDEDYYPVVAVQGDLAVTGDHGQGMLIVLGDLDITGKFFFSGIVVVTGQTFVRGSGGDSRIDGALIALGDVALCNPDNSGSSTCTSTSGTGDSGEDTEFLGNSKILYNTCTVDAATKAFNDAVTNAALTGTVLGRTFAWYEVVR